MLKWKIELTRLNTINVDIFARCKYRYPSEFEDIVVAHVETN